ncbi:MAG: hypothetical protein VB085_08805 [Peptococcaceae bacterium]|nr:hypothetical protein [Peptococcaceae bacterium]
MAKEQMAAADAGMEEVQTLKQRKRTRDSVFAGAAAAEGWRPGRALTEKEYDAAISRFLRQAAGGGR